MPLRTALAAYRSESFAGCQSFLVLEYTARTPEFPASSH